MWWILKTRLKGNNWAITKEREKQEMNSHKTMVQWTKVEKYSKEKS
jgi:hypothetical protein